MWIEPDSYSLKMGDNIFAHEVVGQKFKGNKYAYLDTNYEALNISVGDKTERVKSRLGDLPAIQEVAKEEGLHIITAETTLTELIYTNPDTFNSFLQNEGLQWVIAEHTKRGLPKKGFKEVYRRTPKTLIKVGHGKGKDKAFGMSLEWIVETNPYTTKSKNIIARLLWKGKPAKNMHVNVFNKPKHKSPQSELIKTSLITDAEGRVEIPKAGGGLFLVNSVKMLRPDVKTAKETEAVWESIWASLNYEILLNI